MKQGSARIHAQSGFIPPKWEDQNPSKQRPQALRAGAERCRACQAYFRRRRARKPSATTPTASSGKVLEVSGALTGAANAAALVARAARRRRVFIGGKSAPDGEQMEGQVRVFTPIGEEQHRSINEFGFTAPFLRQALACVSVNPTVVFPGALYSQ